MDFTYTDEQVQLRDAVAAYLRDHYAFEDRRAASVSEAGWRPDVWQALGRDLGLLGLAVPEAQGGVGAGPVEVMIVMEELGRALVIEPYLDTAVIAPALLSGVGGAAAEALLARIATGEAVVAFAYDEPGARYRLDHVETRATRSGDGWVLDGLKSVVVGAPWADTLIVTARTGDGDDGVSLFLVAPGAPGVTLAAYPTIDGRRAADIRFAQAPAQLIGAEGEALPLVERAGDVAIAAIGAEAVGVLRRMLQDTIDYTRQRKQFGQPISSFQVLQHRMVDMLMQVEMAVSAVLLVTLKLDGDPAERARAASSAKVTIANACRFVGQNAIQLHGGMGMTDELAVGHYFKRATVIEREFGSADYHVARYMELSRAAA